MYVVPNGFSTDSPSYVAWRKSLYGRKSSQIQHPYVFCFEVWCKCDDGDATLVASAFRFPAHPLLGGEAGYKPSHLIRRHMTSQATRKEFTQQPTKQILAEVRRNDGFRRNLAS